ncbi:MAG: DMT family transporter [Pseudomonadota bacterium]|nr:DMT family transporter [Pseudomonadota bacterium]
MNLSGDSFAALALLMFLTGIGIPIMATLNGGLGLQLGSPVAASLILCCVGGVIAGAILLVVGTPSSTALTLENPHFYLGGVLFLFYILSITFAGPKIGIGNAVFFFLLGQLVAAAAIDHFGLWGALKHEITPRRVLGIAVMAVGVYLARRPV